MGTKATRKDFYMEIRKSLGRFLSIFFIVAMGVAFFSGIRSAEPDMRITGDSYFDGAELMDIRAVSMLGITKDDVKAIETLKGVAKAEGGYSADFLSDGEDRQIAVHVMSLLPTMNQVTVSSGRMPRKPGECLADDEMNYKVGDRITLLSDTEESVEESLTTDTLTVVGTGNTPYYLSFGRGNTTIGTGSLSGFLMVPEDTFDMEVYTEVYAQAEGAKEMMAFTDAYEDRVEYVMDRIEEITGERGKIRRQELVGDANEELEDAKQELADGKAKAQKELEDAAAVLADGENQINDARARIASGKQEIAEARGTLNAKQKELKQARSQYDTGKKQLEAGKTAYAQGMAEFGGKKAEFDAQAAAVDAQFAEQKQKLDQLKAACDAMAGQIESMKGQLTALLGNISQIKSQIEALEAIPDPTVEEQETLAGLNIQLERLTLQSQTLEAQLRELEENQLPGYQQQYAAGEAAYHAAREKADAELAGYRQQLDAGAADLAASKSTLDAGEARLSKGWSQIQSGQSQLQAGFSELEKQADILSAGEAELSAREAELDEGKAKYEKAKADADQEISEAEEKIMDAEREISRIKHPKWYVYDRNSLPEYSGYGDNADRMKAIGEVFPIMFFLVAALISLTSMTRMVEEQRTEIGTMKALGYSKRTIASKYLGYALLATVGGSILGVLAGEKLLPYIIIYAYGIMYHHLPEIVVPYNLVYAAASTLAAVACTMAATLAACYKELAAQPAVLMRPPAPKKGKRVFLERVPFIWKRLSFIWKSTIRNLMRYKKRFFMTVFGIGGCMALMLVGFGLRDSIFDIADVQYDEIQLYDGTAYLSEHITEKEQKSVEKLLQLKAGIKQYTEVNMYNVTLMNGEKEWDAYECVPKTLQGFGEFLKFRDRRSREVYELTDQGAIISEKTAKMLGAKTGDTIQIKDEENGDKQVRIESICENYMGHYIYLSPKLHEEVYGKQPAYNSIFFKMEDSDRAKLEAAGQELLGEDGVLSISYLHDIEKQLDDMLNSLNLVMVVLIVSAGMLAFVVLYNLNNINITERRRELATIKVLGFYDPEVAAYVYRENVILTFIGGGAGVLMGRILHLFIIRTVEVDNVMFGRNINFPSYIYSLLFTVAFSAFVNWVMYFKLKKIDMVESLKSIE